MPLYYGPRKDMTPKSLSFSELYKFGAKTKDMSTSAKLSARKALSVAGYTESEISKIISDDKKIPISKMKEIAGHLNKSKVYGFSQDANILIDKYVIKQKIKAQNIARVQHEHMMEAMGEDLEKGPTTSLNTLGKGASSSLNSIGGSKTSPSTSKPNINLPF